LFSPEFLAQEGCLGVWGGSDFIISKKKKTKKKLYLRVVRIVLSELVKQLIFSAKTGENSFDIIEFENSIVNFVKKKNRTSGK